MYKEIGVLLADNRERHGLTQEDLARLLGVPRTAISKVETGERRLTTDELLTLTQLFGDSFELGCEHVLSELVPDLATRIRTFLGTTKFAPDRFALRDWLDTVLHKLDHSHVAGAA